MIHHYFDSKHQLIEYATRYAHGILARAARQNLTKAKTPSERLWAIIDESALNRVVGSPEIMRVQRQHLVATAHRPNITIQIIPNSEGATCAFGRAFAVLVSRNNSSVAYFEDVGTARYIRDRDEVSRYNLIFDYLRSCALNDRQSIQLIKGDAK